MLMTFVCSGEYVKDVDFLLLPQDPLLDVKFPRPVVERGSCNGMWRGLDKKNEDEEGNVRNRDCGDEDYLQPLSKQSSEVIFNTKSHPISMFYL